MTYTKPQVNPDLSIIPGEDIEIRAKKMAAAGQKQVARILRGLK